MPKHFSAKWYIVTFILYKKLLSLKTLFPK